MAAGPGSRSTAAPSAPLADAGAHWAAVVRANGGSAAAAWTADWAWRAMGVLGRALCLPRSVRRAPFERYRAERRGSLLVCILQSTLTQVSVKFMRAHSVEHDCFGPEHKRAGPQGESREATDERRRTACVLPVPATTYVPRHSDARPPAYSRVHAHAAATPPGPRREN